MGAVAVQGSNLGFSALTTEHVTPFHPIIVTALSGATSPTRCSITRTSSRAGPVCSGSAQTAVASSELSRLPFCFCSSSVTFIQ